MKRDQGIGLILVVFSGFMYYQATLLPPAMFGALGADVFPKLLFILLLIMGAALFIQATIALKKSTSDTMTGAVSQTGFSFAHFKFVVIGFTAFFLYVILMHYLGFIIATLIFMPGFMWVLSPKTKKGAALIICVSLILTFGMQFGFTYVLKIFLPSGVVF